MDNGIIRTLSKLCHYIRHRYPMSIISSHNNLYNLHCQHSKGKAWATHHNKHHACVQVSILPNLVFLKKLARVNYNAWHTSMHYSLIFGSFTAIVNESLRSPNVSLHVQMYPSHSARMPKLEAIPINYKRILASLVLVVEDISVILP